MKTIVGYGYISNARINKKELATYDITKSNAYKRTKEIMDKIGYPNSNVYIDIFSIYYRKRPKLIELIETLKPGDVIVILSILFLGEKEQLVHIYKELIKKQIGLLIIDTKGNLNELSTVDCKLENRGTEVDLTEIMEKLKTINKNGLKQTRGRSKKEITEKFIEAYWLYEKFLIPEPLAYEIAGINKQTFHRIANEYERTPKYLERLETENKKHNISNKPKRHGAVPKGFVSVIALVDKGASLENACIQSGIQPLNPIDYKRYKLKYFGGRKALAKAMEY